MHQRQQKQQGKLRRVIASFFITLTVLSPVAIGGTVAAISSGALAPTPAHAGAPVIVTESVPDKTNKVLAAIEYNLVTSAKIGWKNAIRAFLERMAYNSAVWLASGAENQRSLTWQVAIGEQLLLATDAALGEFLNTLALSNGFVSFNICDLNGLDKLRIQLILPKILADEPNACTFTEFLGSDYEWEDVDGDGDIDGDDITLGGTIEGVFSQSQLITDIEAFYLNFVNDPKQFVVLSAKMDEGDNALSAMLIAMDKAIGAQTTAKEEAILQRLPTSFKDVTDPISGRVETQAELIKAQIWAQVFRNAEAELAFTDNPVADAVSVFYTTLASKFLERLTTGFLAGLTYVDINDSLSGDVSTTGSSGGVREAQQRYAEFKTATFNQGAEIDILTDFASCPDEGAGVTNCVIDSALQVAIEEGMTLREAFDQGVIDEGFAFGVKDNSDQSIDHPSQGIALRNVQILRAYNVVPVGWELAATYIRDFSSRTYSIGEIAGAYDDCGELADYSPFCGLIDPDWVLKEPQVFCRYEGYGSTKLIEDDIDHDGNDASPAQFAISRQTTCLDPQTCLSEDDSGFCDAWGYCTEQRDIYRFDGQSCPMHYTSCEGFVDSEDNQQYYLQNTLNFNDCDESNVGCQWLCGVYNDVDDEFQCSSENEIYTTCETDGGCTCTATSGDTCEIAEGGFFCETDPDGDESTDDGETCTIGTETESTTELYSITFDDDVQTCSDEEEGCTEFIQIKGGSNLLANGNFESYSHDGTDYSRPESAAGEGLEDSSDTSSTSGYDEFTYGFGIADGLGCAASSSTTLDCIGWEYGGAAKAEVRGVESPFGFTSSAIQLADGGGATTNYIMHRFETEQALENRSFALSFYGRASAADCTIDYWIDADDGTGAAGTNTTTATFDSADESLEFLSDVYTFADGTTETIISVGFYMPNGCLATIDDVKLEENSAASGAESYMDTVTHVNVNDAVECSAGEVGCEQYTPQSGESTTPITGHITNPLSEACGDGSDYTDPSCSQCIAEMVGCDAFIEVPTPYDAPVNDYSLFNSPTALGDEVLTAMADRSGYYCTDDFVACNPSIGCGNTVGSYTSPGSGSCLPSISVIPSSGTQCSAAAVGCEEYVNIEGATEGGEGLEYYSYIQKCVKPTDRQNNDGEIETYFTWEGSDETGFQLRSWDLKVSNDATDEDGDGNSAFGPCTNLDLWDYTGSAESAEAECIDIDLGGVDSCQGDFGSDPSCLEFRDADGNSFYRRSTDIIKVSEQCIGLRNTKDDRLYYALQSDSTSCAASQNQCREYKGSQGSNVQILVEEDFESVTFDENGWEGGSASGETITAGSSLVSMLIGYDTTLASGITETATYDVSELIAENDSYVVTFWAKADSTDLDTLNVSLYSTDGGTTTTYFGDGADLTTDWKQYTLGPLAFDEGVYVGDEVLRLDYEGSGAYIDYLELRRNNSHYLIVDTPDTCNGYEGCEEYQDSGSTTHYLKSFERLCSESFIGCEALIKTQQSNTPFYTEYNTDNEFDEDDVQVATDEVEFYTVTPSTLCQESESGCMLFGSPDLDYSFEVESYEDFYAINDPDDYSTALCEQQSLQCSEFASLDGNAVSYFKAPDDKTCSYSTSLGYWVVTGDEGTQCPVQYGDPEDEGAQPRGAVCNGGERAGLLCSHDDDCPAPEGSEDVYRCVSDAGDASGWVGSCEQSYRGCTLYIDSNTRSTLENSSFETNVVDNDDSTAAEADEQPDKWEVRDEGESNTSGVPDRYRFRDIQNVATVEESDSPSLITFYDYSDLGSGRESWSTLVSISGDVTHADYDPGNGASARAGVVQVAPLATWTEDLRMTLQTSSGTSSSNITIVLEAEVINGISEAAAIFYIGEEGGLYWADTEADGSGSSDGYPVGTDFLSPTDALLNDPATAPTSTIVNGFYDAMGYTGEIGCTTFEQTDGLQTAHSYSLKLGNDGTYETCMVASNSRYEIDPDEFNTVRANVYADGDAEFAVGLLFYTYEDVYATEIGGYSEPEGYAFVAYEGGDRSENDLTSGEWQHFHGTIGPNMQLEVPEDAAEVRPFIEVKSGTVYVDDIRFSPNQEYAYIASTVDGDADSNENSCNGVIDYEAGCVSFRDASFIGSAGDSESTNLTYLSTQPELESMNSSASVESCTFNAIDETVRCSSYANAADSNVVIQVRRDRECSEWLTCLTSTQTTDDDGNITSDVCQSLARCRERNEETGACTDVVSSPSSSLLNESSDTTFVSQSGNTDDLYKLEYLSGFSTVGLEWRGVEDDNSGLCYYGAYSGQPADSNDCEEANITHGFYPYDWMVERGSGNSTSDLVSHGDFEEVLCSGDAEYDNLGDLGLSSTLSLGPVERQRDKTAKCTFDFHCRNTQADQTIETMISSEELDEDSSVIDYEEGWCENVESNSWNEWEASGSAQIMIIDYKFGENFVTASSYANDNGFASVSGTGSSTGAGGVDYNNVMFVNPTNGISGGIANVDADGIYEGSQYTVSFDAVYTETEAVNDYIEIGLAHTNDLGIQTIDYFTTGVPIVEIVFLLDASGSMGDEIDEVADNIVDFASSLSTGSDGSGDVESTEEEEEYSYRFGIVTTGDSDGPYPLDFADYRTVGNYGGDNGATTEFTEDISELQTALQYVAANLIGGSENNYEGIISLVAAGEWVNTNSAYDGYQYDWSSASERFVVLLTDEVPDGGDVYVADGTSSGWDEQDADILVDWYSLAENLGGTGYTLYSLVTDDVDEAYQPITEALGGEMYDLTATDYSGILDDIATDISEAVEPFSFTSTEYKRYELGPLYIENKGDDTDTTELFIRQTAGSTGTNFVLDNVSLKTALEVNKEGNHALPSQPNLISRECRGYPEEDSEFCDYTDFETGIIYDGWEGYCLMPDLWDKSSCAMWWPVDVISGAKNNFSNAQSEVTYEGPSPVYHCLVAKGNEVPGRCRETGEACTSSSFCPYTTDPGSTTRQDCVGTTGGGSGDTVEQSWSWNFSNFQKGSSTGTFNYDHIYTADNGYKIKHVIDTLHIAPSADSHNNAAPSNNDEEAAFFKFTGSQILLERRVHISEIDNIYFNMGTPTYRENGIATDHNHDQNAYMYGKTDWDSRSLEDGGALGDSLWKHAKDDVDLDDGNEPWNTKLDVRHANDKSKSAVQAWQQGWWCNGDTGQSGLCDTDTDPDDFEDAEYTIVKGVTSAPDQDNLLQNNRVYDGGNPFNPFNTSNLVGSSSEIWDDEILIATVHGTTGYNYPSVYTHAFNDGIGSKYFWGRESDPDDDANGDKDNCFSHHPCGVNIMGINFDFEDGYLDAVYLFVWDGLRRLDVKSFNNVRWRFDLKEPCLFMVESVASGGEDDDVVPWMARVNGDSGYEVLDLGYTHTLGRDQGSSSLFTEFGAMLSNDAEPNRADGDGFDIDTDGLYDSTAAQDYNLPLVDISGSGSEQYDVLPYACIGNCTATRCRDDYTDTYYSSSCETDDSDGGPYLYTGIYGICQAGGSSAINGSSGVLCGEADDCSSYNASASCVELSDLNRGGALTNTSNYYYDDQLREAVQSAWERYRLIYADLPDDRYWWAPPSGIDEDGDVYSSSYQFADTHEPYFVSGDDYPFSAFESLLDDFESMPQCSGNERTDDDEYCGVRPTVTEITVSGETEDNLGIFGPSEEVVSLNLAADENQEPIRNIKIIWESEYDLESGEYRYDFDTECAATDDCIETWDAASENSVQFTHLYSCDLDSEFAFGTTQPHPRTGEPACAYKIRVQIEDNWGWCSGNTTDEGPLDDLSAADAYDAVRGTNGGSSACTSYDEYEGWVIVSE